MTNSVFSPAQRNPSATSRQLHWHNTQDSLFDVAILGGGVNGASLFNTLCRRGLRTLLIEHQDFAAGSSQASGMMVWGGLLYLTVGDVFTVIKLSRARDRLIRQSPDWAEPALFRYIPSLQGRMPLPFIGTGLGFYWLLSAGRRRLPGFQRRFGEDRLIRHELHRGSAA